MLKDCEFWNAIVEETYQDSDLACLHSNTKDAGFTSTGSFSPSQSHTVSNLDGIVVSELPSLTYLNVIVAQTSPSLTAWLVSAS